MKSEQYWSRLSSEIKDLADLLNVRLNVPRAAKRHTFPEHEASYHSQEVSVYYKSIWNACLSNVTNDLSAKFGKLIQEPLQYNC